MVFSSIAAVHGIALAAVRGRGIVDLDIIPVFAITGFGMLVGLPMLLWSKTLSEARRSVRSLVFVWIILMFAAVSASTASFKALPTPVPCQSTSFLGSCGLECNVGLPFRAGQVALSIPVGRTTWLFRYSIFCLLRVSAHALADFRKGRKAGGKCILRRSQQQWHKSRIPATATGAVLESLQAASISCRCTVHLPHCDYRAIIVGKAPCAVWRRFLLDRPMGPPCGGFLRPFWRPGEGLCRQNNCLAR